MVLPANDAVTPAGKPVAAPMPVAPVVVNVIGVSAVLIQSVGEDDGALTVLFGLTVTVKAHIAVVPQASIEVHVIVVAPTLKIAPLRVATPEPVLGFTPAPVDV